MLARALALAAAVLLLASGAQAQPALTTVRVGLVPTDDITPLVYAIRSGMFRKQGLDVELESGSSGAAMAAAVVSGSYEFGKSSMLAIVNAYLRKLPLVMVGSEGFYDAKEPFAQFVVAADSDFKSGADFNGKTIGTPSLNDLDELSTKAWIDQTGGDISTLKVVELPQSATIGAVAEHRVDGTVMHYPVLAEALAGGKEKALYPVYSAISPHFVFAAYFTSESYAQQHPDVVRKFVQTIYRAAAYTNAHHAETVAMMADATKAPADTIAHMIRVDGATDLDPKDIQPLIDVAAKYKAIPHAFPASEMLKYAPNVR